MKKRTVFGVVILVLFSLIIASLLYVSFIAIPPYPAAKLERSPDLEFIRDSRVGDNLCVGYLNTASYETADSLEQVIAWLKNNGWSGQSVASDLLQYEMYKHRTYEFPSIARIEWVKVLTVSGRTSNLSYIRLYNVTAFCFLP